MENSEQGKSAQYILNTHLNGVHIDDSNDHILAAMEEYALLAVEANKPKIEYITSEEFFHRKFPDQKNSNDKVFNVFDMIQYGHSYAIKVSASKDKEIAELKASKWISVEESFPETSSLLLTTSGIIILGDWYNDSWRTHRSFWEDGRLKSAFRREDITHWQPLPDTSKLQ